MLLDTALEVSFDSGHGSLHTVGLGIAAVYVVASLLGIWAGWRKHVVAIGLVVNLALITLSMKVLQSPPFNFQFPMIVTMFHFLFLWVACVVYFAWLGDLGKCLPSSLGPDWKRLCTTTVVPIAITLSFSVVANNAALMYIDAGLNSVVNGTSSVATALVSMCFGGIISGRGWAGIFLGCLGSLVVSYNELSDDVSVSKGGRIGLALTCSSVLLRAAKSVLQDMMVNSEQYNVSGMRSISSMHSLALQAPPCTFVTLALSLCFEDLAMAQKAVTPKNSILILGTCILGLLLGVLGMAVMKEVGVNMRTMIGSLSIIMILLVSVTFMGEKLDNYLISGSALVLIGIAVFEMGREHKAQDEDESESKALLRRDTTSKGRLSEKIPMRA